VDNEVLEFLKEFRSEFDSFKKEVNSQFKGVNDKLDNLEAGQKELRALTIELDPNNNCNRI